MRTSENRPQGFREEKGPFQADRLALGEAQVRAEERHRQVHREFASNMEVFSHPACEPLTAKERQLCPLQALRWTNVRDIPQGVELEAERAGVEVQRLRLQLLCHIAFGQGHEDAGCPFYQPTISATATERGDKIIVRLTVEAAQQETLRQQVRLAINPLNRAGGAGK